MPTETTGSVDDQHQQRWTTFGSAGTAADTEAGRLAAAETGASTEEGMSVADNRDALEFNLLRNAIMHTMRQRWFDALHRWLMFLIVLAGTAGVASFATKWVGDSAFAAATAVLATLDLVLDLRPKARLHDDLRRRYYLLWAEVAADPKANEARLAAWQARMLQLTAEEPDLYRAVDCIAYNAALHSLGRDPDHQLVVSWWRRLLAHLFTFPSYNPPQQGELEAKKR